MKFFSYFKLEELNAYFDQLGLLVIREEDKKSNNTNPSSATKVVNKKDKDKKENNDKKTQSKLSTTLPQQKPQKLFNPLQMQQQPIFFPNIIPQNENIFVMEIKPTEKMSSSSHKIEEIIEEKNNEDLDKELEKELEELEKYLLDKLSEKGINIIQKPINYINLRV